MPSLHTLIAFTIVTLGILAIPGPSTFFILAQGATHGRRRAMAAMAGIEIASALRVLATAAGLIALLAACQPAFQAIRWLGVGYLTYLAINTLRTETVLTTSSCPTRATSRVHLVRKGLLVGLGNPKMAVFYLSLFPQFLHAGHGSDLEQILVLGGLFWILGVLWDACLTIASGSVGTWLHNRPRAQTAMPKAEGATYLVLAGWAALAG